MIAEIAVIAGIAEIGPHERRRSNVGIEMHDQLRDRTKQFALRIIRLSRHLPAGREADVIAKPVLRSGTAVAANYRAAGRSRSRADFISKISIVAEEADETMFWLELLEEAGLLPANKLGRSSAARRDFYRLTSHCQGMIREQRTPVASQISAIPAISRDFGDMSVG